VLIKVVNKLTSLRHKEEEAPEPEPAPAPEPEPTKEELLLTEIRDLLKQQQK
jgi:large conductance mechanosensitive channel